MSKHEWTDQGFVHGSPERVDCWDRRAKCAKCDTLAVLLGRGPEDAVPRAAYEIHVGKRVRGLREEALKKVRRVPDDCDQRVVDLVHRL